MAVTMTMMATMATMVTMAIMATMAVIQKQRLSLHQAYVAFPLCPIFSPNAP